MGEAPHIPGYEVTGAVGFGASGAAWAVRPTGATPGDGAARVAAVLPRDGRQSRLQELAALRHPNMPAIDAVLELDEHRLAVIMELVPGPSLATLVNARSWLDRCEVVAVWRGVGDALAALHRRGLVHGDVSPANIVVTPQGVPVLVDIVGHDGAEVGHLGYSPPEVLAGSGPSTAGDVWSFARTLAWSAGEDPAAHAALAPALADDPASRPDSARFHTMAFLLGQPGELRSPGGAQLAGAQLRAQSVPTRLAPPPRRRPWKAWLAAGAAVALTAMLLITASEATGSAPAARAVQRVEPPGRATARAAVVHLVAERDAVFNAGQPERLASVHLEGETLRADAALLHQLGQEGTRLLGYRTTVGPVDVVTASRKRLVVEARLTQEEHQRRAADGAVRVVPSQPESCVQLELTRVPPDWRVRSLGQCR